MHFTQNYHCIPTVHCNTTFCPPHNQGGFQAQAYGHTSSGYHCNNQGGAHVQTFVTSSPPVCGKSTSYACRTLGQAQAYQGGTHAQNHNAQAQTAHITMWAGVCTSAPVYCGPQGGTQTQNFNAQARGGKTFVNHCTSGCPTSDCTSDCTIGFIC